MTLTVSLIYGSVRKNRLGIQVAKYLEGKLSERNIRVHFIDPLEYPLPLLDKMYKDYEPGTAPALLERLAKRLVSSDGFLLVTGEYNHTLPPALTNLLDHFHAEYQYKPSAIASYSDGSFGGVRAADHLRMLAGQLGMPAIPFIQPFPEIESLFDDKLNLQSQRIEASTQKFLDQFIWYLEAFRNQREQGTRS
ncbi:MAG: NAD(P)H-dependent oxidoreductase [Bacteroidales bacterium]|nr:NAD(P)H-dependent oxidoreductase [Bacteroidales bacterium]